MFSMKTFRPLNNWILIKIDKESEADIQTTASGIVVVNKNKPKGRDSIATIIKVGSHMYTPQGTRVDLANIFHEGDKILYYNPAGSMKVEIDDEEYILVRAEDIDCIIEE